MNEQQLEAAREEFRASGELTDELVEQLGLIVHRLVAFGHLPPSYAPYGRWDEEAEEEVFQGWVTERLLGAGGLLNLLDRAVNPRGFRAMAERSLRQYILNQRERSQAQNLYWRVADLLQRHEWFVEVSDAKRTQDVVWGIADQTDHEPFAGDDRRLLAFAWSLGDFELIRYKTSAAKLSPLLSASELERFVHGLIDAAGPMKLGEIADALRLRFNLGAVDSTPADADQGVELTSDQSVEDDEVFRQTALSAISVLTNRQIQVLLGVRAETTWEELATELGCSAATIANEEKRIRLVMERHSENDHEARQLLRIVGDLLYEHSGDG